MTVRQFVIENGIEALNGKPVIDGGIEFRIKLSEHDIDEFNAKGSFRLSASMTDEHGNDYAVFVHPSTELVEETKLPTYKEQLSQLITGLKAAETFLKQVEEITGDENKDTRFKLWAAYKMASEQLKVEHPQEYIQHQKDMALVYANNAEYFDKLKVTFNKS